jgi:hypothetical protein
MNTAMTYAHSHEAVTTYTAFLENDESPTSTKGRTVEEEG